VENLSAAADRAASTRTGIAEFNGCVVRAFWDVQKKHATFSGPNDGHGYDVLINENAPKEYLDLERYTTPEGLSEIMR
jgi:hypothetical protein